MKRSYPFELSDSDEVSSTNELPLTETFERPTKRFAYEEDSYSSSTPPSPFSSELNLSGSCEPTFNSIPELPHLCSQLVSLNLSYCNYFSDEHMLVLMGVTESDLPLQYVDLSCTQITDAGMKLLISKCPHLLEITLRGCHNITDITLSLLAQHCNRLQRLVLSECTQISDLGVQLVAQETKQNLRVLDLSGCTKITDSTLTYLGYYCPNIANLLLKNTLITQTTLAKLLPRLSLSKLNVHGIAISNQFLFLVARFQHATLRVLDISFCYNVNIDGVKRIVEEVDLLRDFSFFGLAINQRNLSALQTRFPSINYHH